MLDKRISESFDRKLREMSRKSAGSILESVHTLNEEELDEMALYDLQPEHDSRSSFYNKAIVDIDNNTGDKTLYSYHTPVAKISKSGELELLPKWNSSNTTLRHVKEFLRQNGFKADSLKQITKDYLSESVEENLKENVETFRDDIKDYYKLYKGGKITADEYSKKFKELKKKHLVKDSDLKNWKNLDESVLNEDYDYDDSADYAKLSYAIQEDVINIIGKNQIESTEIYNDYTETRLTIYLKDETGKLTNLKGKIKRLSKFSNMITSIDYFFVKSRNVNEIRIWFSFGTKSNISDFINKNKDDFISTYIKSLIKPIEELSSIYSNNKEIIDDLKNIIPYIKNKEIASVEKIINKLFYSKNNYNVDIREKYLIYDIRDIVNKIDYLLWENESLKEEIGEPDVASFVEEIKLVVDPEDIDTHESDLYVKVSPKVTEILKKYNMLDNPLLSKFIDEIDHEEWYEIPFGNLGKRIETESLTEELDENTKKEVEVELEDILKRNPEKHGFDADTEEVKYYVVKLLKDKGYKTETSGNDNYKPNKYHVEYWKE